MPWPRKPHTMPARLYSRNLTPMHAMRLPTLKLFTPRMEASNTAEGTPASSFWMPGAGWAQGGGGGLAQWRGAQRRGPSRCGRLWLRLAAPNGRA
jgi:hypothetical protein